MMCRPMQSERNAIVTGKQNLCREANLGTSPSSRSDYCYRIARSHVRMPQYYIMFLILRIIMNVFACLPWHAAKLEESDYVIRL
jgi:hypothetical protein